MEQGICRCGETYFGFEYQHELIGGELIKMSLEHVAAASEMEKVWLGDDPGNRARDRIIRTIVTLERCRNVLHISFYTYRKSNGVIFADRRITSDRGLYNL